MGRGLSGTQIFSLSHASVKLKNSSFTFHHQAQNTPSSFTYQLWVELAFQMGNSPACIVPHSSLGNEMHFRGEFNQR